MSTYLFLDILIICVPLALSFERRVQYFRKWPAVLFSIATVGSAYILWDFWATAQGHWAFNPRHVAPVKFLSLPLEEILFFVVVPFSCLFIYEVISYFRRDRRIFLNPKVFYWPSIGFLILAFVSSSADYLAMAFFMMAVFLFIAVKCPDQSIALENFWIYLAISFIMFLIFNGILTGLPVVTYHPVAVSGVRVGTIPVEDFFYNFAYLGLTFFAYRAYLERR